MPKSRSDFAIASASIGDSRGSRESSQRSELLRDELAIGGFLRRQRDLKVHDVGRHRMLIAGERLRQRVARSDLLRLRVAVDLDGQYFRCSWRQQSRDLVAKRLEVLIGELDSAPP